MFLQVCVCSGEGYLSSRFFPRSLVPGPFCMGATPVPGSFPSHWPQVLSWGTPVPGFFPGHWSQVISGGMAQSWLGVQQSWPVRYPTLGWVPPWPGQLYGTLRARSEWGTPHPWDGTAERRVVCLLRSRRRTFLFLAMISEADMLQNSWQLHTLFNNLQLWLVLYLSVANIYSTPGKSHILHTLYQALPWHNRNRFQ